MYIPSQVHGGLLQEPFGALCFVPAALAETWS
jgi:hypothetical protein